MKHCNQCLISKPTVDFYKNRAKADGCSDQCKLCCRKNSAKLRVTNPDKARYAVRRARESNRDAYNARRRGALGAERRSKYAARNKSIFRNTVRKTKPSSRPIEPTAGR